ncbi:MAG: RES family NAD+ phosphorylase [Saprospiraceae bacterium]|nr:RES family NAD+ phosphorylase [Saprospiraceae bacterium]
MLFYRITRDKYAQKLLASGRSNRWNRSNEYVIYAATTRSLAMLEMLVHRSGIYPNSSYKMLLIECELGDSMQIIHPESLPKGWRSMAGYTDLQQIGSDWYRASNELILKIPSAIVPQEYNVIINTRHGLFSENVTIVAREDLYWDPRLLD